jgi:hypothetical protein
MEIELLGTHGRRGAPGTQQRKRSLLPSSLRPTAPACTRGDSCATCTLWATAAPRGGAAAVRTAGAWPSTTPAPVVLRCRGTPQRATRCASAMADAVRYITAEELAALLRGCAKHISCCVSTRQNYVVRMSR